MRGVLSLASLFGGVGHHVVDTLHLGAHLENGGGALHKSHGGFHKLSHESLERHQHTDGELSVEDECGTEDEDERVGEMTEDEGPEGALLECHLLIVATGEGACPKLEEASFGSCRLDALDVIHARHCDAIELAFALFESTGEVGAQFAFCRHGVDIECHNGYADNGEQHTVLRHHHNIYHQQGHIHCIGGEDSDEGGGDMLVERLALHDVAHISLGEKFYREIESMPKESGVALEGHAARKTSPIDIVEQGKEKIEHHKTGYADEEGDGPLVVFAGDDAVEEHLGEEGIYHTRKRHENAHQQCEDEGILGSANVLAYIM